MIDYNWKSAFFNTHKLLPTNTLLEKHNTSFPHQSACSALDLMGVKAAVVMQPGCSATIVGIIGGHIRVSILLNLLHQA